MIARCASRRIAAWVAVAQLATWGTAGVARGCPFCNALTPTFSERRAVADAVVLGEAAGGRTFRIVQVPQGREALGPRATLDLSTTELASIADAPTAGLALLLGKLHDGAWSWEAVAVDEASAAYFLRMPAAERPTVERLRYCAKYLEHPNEQVADDAYGEFGRASYDDVRRAADALPQAALRRWIVDPAVPERRKGFYGLALGLAPDVAERRTNAALLRRLATAAGTDFRAGFDGLLGGWLIAEGAAALDAIEARILANPQAAEGDVRHAQAALRFYVEYGRALSADRMARSTALLLDRPATAPGALADLTRARRWEFVSRAERLFVASAGDDPALDRAAIGYLLVCPEADAAAALRRVRLAQPRRYAEAERHWAMLGVRPAAGD